MQKVLFGLPTLVCVTKNKHDFVIQFYLHHFGVEVFFPKGKMAVVQSWPLPYMPSWHALG
jgi:hypothetical protein